MSHRSNISAGSCRVNMQEPSVCFTGSSPSAVFQVGLPSFQIPTTMSDSKSLNTSLLKVMISANNDRVFIRDMSDVTSQIIVDAWWASMNVDSKPSIAWSNSRPAPLWQFYLHCGIEETGSPGIICIVYHQVFAIHQNMGLAQWGNTCWRKLPSQS